MKWLWPICTGRTLFDVWTIFHLAFWLYCGSNAWSFQHILPKTWAIALGLCIAFAWEVFERFAEKKWPHIWQTPESFLNAWVSDPLTCVVGILIAWWLLDNWRV